MRVCAGYEAVERGDNGTEFVWPVEGEEAGSLVELKLNRVLVGARRKRRRQLDLGDDLDVGSVERVVKTRVDAVPRVRLIAADANKMDG